MRELKIIELIIMILLLFKDEIIYNKQNYNQTLKH